jgi:hypothetical protein
MAEDNKTDVVVDDNTSGDKLPTASKDNQVATIRHQTVSNLSSLGRINLLDETEVAKAEVFLKRMLRTEKSGIKSIEDGLAIIMKAQDLGLPFSSCIEHIHVINGKTGVDIHIIKALLLKAGVVWKCTKNYTPQYEYTDGSNAYIENQLPDYCVKCKNAKEAAAKTEQYNKDNPDSFSEVVYVYPVKYYKDYNGNVYKEYQINSNFAIALNNQHAQVLIKQNKIPVYRIPAIPVDYVTEYHMEREYKGKHMETVQSFSYSEAVAADCFTKDTYKKYPKVMIGHRAFTYAARDIAADVVQGLMETTELKVVTGRELSDNDAIEIEDAQLID